MLINREYNHRRFGLIGKVDLVVPEGAWKLDGKILPASSVEHLATFALQTLQDAYAGNETKVEAEANWAKKLVRLLEGTLGTRGGEGLSDLRSIAVYRLFVAALDADAKKRFNKAFDSQSARVRKALEASNFDDATIEAEVAKIEAERKAKAEEDAARKATVSKLADKITIDF